MKNNIFAVILIIIVIVVAFAGIFLNKTPKTPSDKIPVVASFYPLAHFVKQVGGDNVSVVTTTPIGSEPHDYEPTPQDIVTIRVSKLFVFNGNGLDSWADKIKNDLPGVNVLRVADNIDSSGSLDPHFWLDPVLAEKEVVLIRDQIISVDPANTVVYKVNAAEYIKKLQQLDQDFKTGLANCASRDIITSHAAFGYLAKRYNLNQIAIAGISPDEEPSPKRLAEIADLVKIRHIKYIFFETLVSPKLAQTISSETGAKAIVFNPLEGLTSDEYKSGKNYISIMQENLTNLRQALDCQ